MGKILKILIESDKKVHFFYEKQFLQKIVLKTVSMALDKKDVTKNLKFEKINIFY